jgi:hypothetical protein
MRWLEDIENHLREQKLKRWGKNTNNREQRMDIVLEEAKILTGL